LCREIFAGRPRHWDTPQYIDETGDCDAIVGRKVALDPCEVRNVAEATMEIGVALLRLLPIPD